MTEEEKKAQEEAAAAEKEKQAQALADAEARAKASEEARIRAEAERDGFKAGAASVVQPPAAAVAWNQDQWDAFQAKTGMTKEGVTVVADMLREQQAALGKTVEERVTAAEKKAQEAENRAKRLESSKFEDVQKSDFLGARPELARHKADMDAFINRFPESERSDPKKYRELLDMAATYVRGKVGNALKTPNANTRGGGLDGGNYQEPDNSDGIDRADVQGLRRAEAATVNDIVSTFTPESDKELKSRPGILGPGVTVSAAEVWAKDTPRFAR